MPDSLDQRLDEAIARRTDGIAKKQRIEGRLEAARKSLSEVEEECRAKGVDPEKLDETIQQLEDRYRSSVEQLEQQVSEADAALAKYV